MPGVQGGRLTHGPPQGTVSHCCLGVGVGGGVGAGESGTHSHPAVASTTAHRPSRVAILGQALPGGHGGAITQSPSHGTLLHCGVGAGGGVCPTGAHAQVPAASDWHWPMTARPSPPLSMAHGTPKGQGNGRMHAPPHGTLLHCGVGVGAGVCGAGTHAQSPAAVISHWPRVAGTSGPPWLLHVSPSGHGNGTERKVQEPPHGMVPHCGVGVGCGGGHCSVQI